MTWYTPVFLRSGLHLVSTQTPLCGARLNARKSFRFAAAAGLYCIVFGLKDM